MMKKKQKMYVPLIVVLLILVVVAFVLFFGNQGRHKTKNVSLIVYGSNSTRWENLRAGAEIVCEEYDAELTLVNMSSEKDVAEQIELINREIRGGADALLIAACDSEAIGEYIRTENITIPIVYVENGVTDPQNEITVTADNYEMGRCLGEDIISRENPIVKVAIISDGTQKESVRLREQGVRDVLEPYVNQIVTWERNENEANMLTRKFLQREMLEEAVDVVVALDNETADALMDALDNLNRKTKAYAITTSEQSVYCLDQGKFKAIEYQTEFAMGYIGAEYALDRSKVGKRNLLEEIQFRIVDRNNMYEKDNQTLIFPYVQ